MPATDSEVLYLVAERAELLAVLAEGPTSPRDAVEAVDLSRSTLNRALNELAERELVERTSEGYVTTLPGRIVLDRYRAFSEETAGALAASEVLAPLGPDAPVEAAMTAGADAVVGTETEPYRPVEALHETVRAADAYRAVLPALDDPRHVRVLYEHVVVDDHPAELVVGDQLADRLVEGFPRRLAVMADCEFTFRVGDVPDVGVVVTEVDGDRTATAVVYGEDGVHGVLVNDDSDAVAWADDLIDTAAAAADERTPRLREATDGGLVAAGDGARIRGPPPLLADLEREGFVRLSPDFFVDRPVAEPTTAWRAGLDLGEVYTGYAVERIREDGDPLTDALIDALQEGDNRVLVGPPGSGKSTTCKRVACEWHDADRGPVLYRASGRAVPFESVDALASTLRDADGHALVVVEDAVRPDAAAVFEAIDQLADREDVSFLLDAREREWADPPGELPADAPVSVTTVPPLDEAGVQRVIDHFERTAGVDVGVSAARLHDAVRGEAADAAAPAELLLLLHRLTRHADPLADGDTSLEEAVAAAYDGLAADELTLDVATLANALNAAGIDVRPSYLHAVAGPDEHDAVRAAIDRLRGTILFGVEPPYRTVHESWSAAFLAHLLEADDAPAERFGRVTSALLSLADDPDRGRRLAAAADDYAAADPLVADPAGWADDRLDRLLALGQERPKLAPLFDDGGTTSVAVPAAGATTADRATARLGRMLVAGAYYDRATAVFENLPETGSSGVERLLGLARAAHGRGEFDTAERYAEWCLDRAGDDRESAARARQLLGRVADSRGNLETARGHFAAARETFDTVGDRRRVAAVDRQLGETAINGSDYDRARERLTAALSTYRDLEQPTAIARVLQDLGVVDKQLGDYEAATRRLRRSLERSRELGDRAAVVESLRHLAQVAQLQGDYRTARDHLERALRVADDLGDRPAKATILKTLGDVARKQGALDDSVSFLEESLALARELGDRQGESGALSHLGLTAKARSDYETAREHLREAVSIAEAVGDTLGAAGDRDYLGMVEKHLGNLETAREHHEAALKARREVGHDPGLPVSLGSLAEVETLLGDYETAADYARDSLEIDRELGDAHGEGVGLDGLARLERRRGDYAAARRYHRECLAAYDGLEVPLYRASALRNRARTALLVAGPDRAAEHAHAALELAREGDDTEEQLLVRLLLARCASRRGDDDAVADHLSAAATRRDQVDAPRPTGDYYLTRGAIERRRGQVATAATHLETARDHWASYGDPYRRAGAELALARLAAARRDRETAVDRATSALTSFEDLGTTHGALASRVLLARQARRADDLGSADDRLEGVVEAATTAGLVRVELCARRERGLLALARGSAADAADDLSQARELAADSGHAVQAARLEGDLGAVARARGDLDLARERFASAVTALEDAAAVPFALDAAERLVAVCDRAGAEDAAREWCELARSLVADSELSGRGAAFDRRSAADD